MEVSHIARPGDDSDGAKTVIHYTLDDEPQIAHTDELTAGEILSHGGIDPKTHYLVRISGERKEYRDPHTIVELHEGEAFISVFSGPTPVS